MPLSVTLTMQRFRDGKYKKSTEIDFDIKNVYSQSINNKTAALKN